MLRSAFALPCAALLVAALTAAASAQSVEGVAPGVVSYGTEITVTGAGFGADKPKVLLVPAGTDTAAKPVKLSVLSFSDTEVVAVVKKKVPAGSYTLQVQPKGKGSEPIAAAEPLSVALPSGAQFTPVSAAAGDVVTMTASHLGTKQGSILVGGKKAKVQTWDAGSSAVTTADGAPLGTVTFKLGKKTPAGLQPVVVKNTAGEVSFASALDVDEPDPGGGGGPGIPDNPYSSTAPGITFLIDGASSPLFGPPYKDFTMQGTTTHKVWAQAQGFQKIEVYVDYFNNVPSSPDKTKTLQQPKVHIIYSTLGGIWTTTNNPAVGDVLPGSSATITVTGQAQSFFGPSFGGAFSGTLVRVSGSGPETISLTDGFFWTISSPG